MTKDLDRYCKTLSRGLFCSRSNRKRFVGNTRKMAEDFLKDKPDATYQDIEMFLGEPKTLTETFMETIDPKEIHRYKRNRRIVRRIVMGVLIILPIVVIAYLCRRVYYMSQFQADVKITKEVVKQVVERIE